jgi:hypothetical protein
MRTYDNVAICVGVHADVGICCWANGKQYTITAPLLTMKPEQLLKVEISG